MPKRKAYNVIVSSDDDDEKQEVKETSDDGEEEEESESESVSEEEEDDDDDESSKRQTLKQLLEPFSKDQIIDLLKEAALKDPSILSRIIQKAESDPTHRKIFIHGLGWDATEEQLLQVFKPFGDIEEVKLITDKVTGRAKGYAFVLFKTISAARKALEVPQKRIGNRTASCQLASLGRPAAGNNAVAGAADVNPSQRKLFVMNVAPTVNVDRLRDFFGKFGEIENGPMGLDPVTNKPRGYAIFTYRSVDGLKRALEEPVKLFEGCQLNCKKFIEGLQSNSNAANKNVNVSSDANYGFGLNAGEILGSNLSAGGMLMQQNPGIGMVANPMWAAAALNQSGLGAAMAGMGGNYGINSISPSVLVSYGGSHAALQGLGAQIGQAPVGDTGSARNQSTLGSSGLNFPSYFNG